MRKEQIEAFWSKVQISQSPRECWPWLGAKKPTGYGNIRIDQQYRTAHRVSFELCHGPIPGGFVVCHICDNPSCCNPQHLMLGTTKSNAADMLLKNRQKGRQHAARGEANGNSKLTMADVALIRQDYASGNFTQHELAGRHGVSQPTIGLIVRNETWRRPDG